MDVTGQPSRGHESRQIAAQFQDRFEQMGSGVGGALQTGQLPSGNFPR